MYLYLDCNGIRETARRELLTEIEITITDVLIFRQLRNVPRIPEITVFPLNKYSLMGLKLPTDGIETPSEDPFSGKLRVLIHLMPL